MNNNHQRTLKEVQENRRRLVMSLRLRGATQREIITQLAANGHINQETGQPWSLGVINKDIQVVTAEWREERLKSIDEHVARQLAELFEVKRSAWSQKELDIVLRALKQETDLLGTNAPSKQEHSGSIKLDLSTLTNEQLQRIVSGDDPATVITATNPSGG